MLDIRFIRENSRRVQEASEQKGFKVDIDHLLRLDSKRRDLLGKVEALRKERNDLSSNMKQQPSDKVIALGRELKQNLATEEGLLQSAEESYLAELKKVPNMPLDHVPVGATEDDNVVVRTVGEPTKFNFEPKNHWQIAEARDWIDKERAVKVAGARFAYVKGDLVRLHFALVQFGLDVLSDQEVLKKIIAENNLNVSSKPFTPVMPPAVARTDVYDATGRLNKEEQTYKLADDDLWLNASAEHTMAPMYLGEILDEAELPIRLLGYTT